jgi:hypothetical protein
MSPYSNSHVLSLNIYSGMRMYIEHAHALLIASGLPRFLWAEAMCHSV